MRKKGKAIGIPLSVAAFVFAVVLAVGGTAYAFQAYLDAFIVAYPAANGTNLDACVLCHNNPAGGGPLNPYGTDYADAAIGDHTFNATLGATDSDLDTFTNDVEIAALTFPGDNTSFPAAVDNTAPTVDSTYPADNAVNVPVNTLVVARFSEPINTATVIDNSFIVNNGGVVNGTIAFSADNTAATFTSNVILTDNTVYTATLTTDVMDLAGNALADNVVWTFTTDNTVDSTAPSVVSAVPSLDNTDTNVATNTSIMATFSEGIDPVSVDNASFSVVNGGPVAGTISVTDNTVTFTPSADLNALTVYTVTLSTGVTDLAGNALADNVVWTFTTGVGNDVTPPTVLSTSPVAGATGVLVTTTISATFSEAIDPATVDNTSYVTNGVDNVDGTLSFAGNTVTFTPDANLAASTTYDVILSGSITDLAGNPMGTDYTWSFTTRAASSPSSDGGSCSINGSGGNGGGGALLFLTLLAILVTLRLKVARARR